MRFHIGMAEACHSPRLVAAMTEVQGQMTDLIERIPHPDVVLTRANAQHRRLVALLHRHDAGGAVQLMREHCAGTEHILAGLMPEQPATLKGLTPAESVTQVSFAPPPLPAFTTIEPCLSATRLIRRGEGRPLVAQ